MAPLQPGDRTDEWSGQSGVLSGHAPAMTAPGCGRPPAPFVRSRDHRAPPAIPSARSAPPPRAIRVLGFVSLLMDLSSATIHSLMPLFMVGWIGRSVFSVGLIEGIAEFSAPVTKGPTSFPRPPAAPQPGDGRRAVRPRQSGDPPRPVPGQRAGDAPGFHAEHLPADRPRPVAVQRDECRANAVAGLQDGRAHHAGAALARDCTRCCRPSSPGS